jgi:HK97 family phage major capsid protein
MNAEQLRGFIQDVIKGVLDPLRERIERQEADWKKELQQRRQPETPRAEKGFDAVRVIRALAVSKNDPERAASWAKKQWGDDAVTRALSASDMTAGGFLLPAPLSEEVIELLRPRVVVRKLGALTIPMDNGTTTMPKLTAGSSASYIGENRNIANTAPTGGQVKFADKKLAALVVLSNDLIRTSSSKANTVVRSDLIRAMSQREDKGFIRDDGTEDKPKGLRYWAPAANQLAANATVNLANVTYDLGRMILALKNADVPLSNPGWIFAPRTEMYLMTVRDANGNYAFRDEMMTGKLWSFPYATTTQVPITLGSGSDSEIYFVDFDDVVIAEASTLIIDASSEAAYYDGSAVQAAFSKDQTVIRAIARHDFGVRHDASVCVLTGVTWAPS